MCVHWYIQPRTQVVKLAIGATNASALKYRFLYQQNATIAFTKAKAEQVGTKLTDIING